MLRGAIWRAFLSEEIFPRPLDDIRDMILYLKMMFGHETTSNVFPELRLEAILSFANVINRIRDSLHLQEDEKKLLDIVLSDSF